MAGKFKVYYSLLPFSLIYNFVTFIRNKLFDFKILKSKSFNVPMICVGNLAVGGTGKTPHAEYIIRLLKDNYRVALLSRGYRRKSKGFRISTKNMSVDELGDEPFLIAQKFPNIIVAVDADRREGVKKLMALKEPPQVIILDDAFQHRYVKAGLNILLTDFSRPYFNDYVMPMGRLREASNGETRADMVVVTKSPHYINSSEKKFFRDHIAVKNVFFSSLVNNSIISLADNSERKLTKDTPVLLVTGIAQPHSLIAKLQQDANLVGKILFDDHHDFTKKDMEMIVKEFKAVNHNNDCVIVVTEKYAVKIRRHALKYKIIADSIYFITLDLLFDEKERFNQTILEYVRKN